MTNKQRSKVISKKQLSRREREERQRRMLYIAGGIVLATIVLVLGFGLYQEYVVEPSSPVATVAGEPISTREYQAMVL